MKRPTADEGLSLACASRMRDLPRVWALPLTLRCPHCQSSKLRPAGLLLMHPRQVLAQCLDCTHVFTVDLPSLRQTPLH